MCRKLMFLFRNLNVYLLYTSIEYVEVIVVKYYLSKNFLYSIQLIRSVYIYVSVSCTYINI